MHYLEYVKFHEYYKYLIKVNNYLIKLSKYMEEYFSFQL